ncbi:Hypothetical predicted protein [Olea europaea subsp. europaea]|uniref:Uncharacterized protein n=1 Tax=Olea europaea subsp. europaea TaxID=158383 RepID=A0A8S0T7E5_OLEEU|nr:Hypothetical predicted protein [Olea europaea subsp. europaea]
MRIWKQLVKNADFKFFQSIVQPRITGLKPRTLVGERLATVCPLPILLVGVLGHPSKHEELTQYLRNLFIQSFGLEGCVLPALVTLGSDQNLNVKYANIDAFKVVAQHFKSDMIVDNIWVQMDAFLEDGSVEATIAVVRALAFAVPHTTNRLREYIIETFFWWF